MTEQQRRTLEIILLALALVAMALVFAQLADMPLDDLMDQVP